MQENRVIFFPSSPARTLHYWPHPSSNPQTNFIIDLGCESRTRSVAKPEASFGGTSSGEEVDLSNERSKQRSLGVSRSAGAQKAAARGRREREWTDGQMEQTQPTPHMEPSLVRSSFPPIPEKKPIAEENMKGIYSDLANPMECCVCLRLWKEGEDELRKRIS